MPPQAKVGRHPLEAKAVGVLQNGKFKINIFSIRWSDHNDIVIYRTFEDFKKMHRELRKRLPLESGLLRKSETMIPKLRDVPIFRINRSSSRCIERLRLLQRYSQDLLKTDNKISQCEIVMAFFTPTNKDLKADFPENSMVILPSESREPQKREASRQLPQPPASEPIVSQMYVCIEDYETKDTKNRAFKVKRNEQLGVLIKESSGWWLVENEEKRVAWFPAPFLKTVEKEEDTDSRTESEDEGVRYYTTTSYDAMSCDELSISRGVLVEVREKSNNGWWLIRYNGKTGFVPAMYLKPYRNCHQLETMMTQGTSMLNLFKASSSLEMNRPEELGSQDDSILAPHNADRASKVTLDRRKSRSISGFPLNTQYGFQHPPTDSTQKDKVVAPGPGPEIKPKLPKKEAIGVPPLDSKAIEEPPTPQPRKISVEAIVMESSPSRPIEASRHHNSHLDSAITPQVPQRPRQHEILSKCTTATKMALKKREIAPMCS
ncbi:NADPH oxidase organizer 1-like isoform X2 [Hyla sarda]|uniref:NADPH oxidase organizer 1-like isoform X2 n=1 Tax=Hyla sarda TaxID=327740 RepID=UPI0024C28C64|nr:NADPH oxidase organizer 1-like isoform X2 [Hyla sarda]XP_056391690.1 NADPH oxidase organizer 1-like isoform X2 [Hyla sarda]